MLVTIDTSHLSQDDERLALALAAAAAAQTEPAWYRTSDALTVHNASMRINRSAATIMRWARQGRIRSHRQQRPPRWYVNIQDVVDYEYKLRARIA